MRFWLDACELEVVSLQRRWYEPGWSYFRVVAGDARTYTLRQSADGRHWELVSMGPR